MDRISYSGNARALTYCITDGTADLSKIPRSVDFLQIREKHLTARQLLEFTRAVLRVAGTAKIVVNDRADIAMAAGAHGVHLRSDSLAPGEMRHILRPGMLIGVSCHTLDDVRNSEAADFVVFGPVFDSPGKGPAQGLEVLKAAARTSSVPIFALGGITWENAQSCLEHGASGIAGIRLFVR